MNMNMRQYFTSVGWDIAGIQQLPPRPKEIVGIDDLPLAAATRAFLAHGARGLYRHQRVALEGILRGEHVCLTTGTASGKSLAFYAAAIERLERDPQARVLAMYPLKALGREQQERWIRALAGAGIAGGVERIDGQVPQYERAAKLRSARVVIATPDIVHAWLLSNLSEKPVMSFLRGLSVIVVDEIHNYTGVFGSNSAFLFRRLQHVLELLGAHPQYVCASATISDPAHHLLQLFGLEFTVIGPDMDSSPKHPVEIVLATPPASSDLLTSVSNLLGHLATHTTSRFIAFVDSRKQVEHIASILARPQEKDVDQDISADEVLPGERGAELIGDELNRLNVLPFRAGYEAYDRDAIQDRLSQNTLRGVVSTSALELGLDIPWLDAAILVGVPHSSTSLYQRIGRIGRHQDGTVIIINTGDLYDQAIFADPSSLLRRPMAESALYLENRRIQYIHALCLARASGEHDQICAALKRTDDTPFASACSWPDGFLDLCAQERLGTIPIDLQTMKAESGDDPNHTFPLRDVESQFRVELKQGPEQQRLGSLSYGQMLREAYPGAVYYYITRPYRVYSVYMGTRVVQVRRDKRYTTRPQMLPTQVFPNLGAGNVYRARRHGELIIAECNVQIRESLSGYKERRGPNEFPVGYPMDYGQTGISFKLPRFLRNYFTSGVIVSHPALNRDKVDREKLASLLYESFLILIPFERQDLNFAAGKHLIQQGPITPGLAFAALYDQTYGSLRLSGRLLEDNLLPHTVHQALELARQQEVLVGEAETQEAIEAISESLMLPGEDISFGLPKLPTAMSEQYARVIMPGSKGWDVNRANEEYEVEAIFFSPAQGGLAYRGRRASNVDPLAKDLVPIAAVIEIPGESVMGCYSYDTGEVIPEN